jgi:hypothetical protein
MLYLLRGGSPFFLTELLCRTIGFDAAGDHAMSPTGTIALAIRSALVARLHWRRRSCRRFGGNA